MLNVIIEENSIHHKNSDHVDDESIFEFDSVQEETKGPGTNLSQSFRKSSTNINANGGNASSKERQPEINSEEYEKIRIMLGAGQYDN